jgi:hypothetical protein
MSDFIITVNYDPKTKTFSYIDEGHRPASVKQHCRGGQTIQWKAGSGVATLVSIDFEKDGNPFVPPTSHLSADVPYTFSPSHTHKMAYDYSVTILPKGSHTSISNDPQLMFDDGSPLNTMTPEMVRDHLSVIGAAVRAGFEGLAGEIDHNLKLQRDTKSFFFPGGITSIQANVTAFGVTVGFTVSGPDGK